jgi:hypothetical protein
MPSPFPGMDPYIEQRDFWSDFHNDLAAEIRAALNQQIQPKYFARNTRYVTYDVLEIDSRAAFDQHGTTQMLVYGNPRPRQSMLLQAQPRLRQRLFRAWSHTRYPFDSTMSKFATPKPRRWSQ